MQFSRIFFPNNKLENPKSATAAGKHFVGLPLMLQLWIHIFEAMRYFGYLATSVHVCDWDRNSSLVIEMSNHIRNVFFSTFARQACHNNPDPGGVVQLQIQDSRQEIIVY